MAEDIGALCSISKPPQYAIHAVTPEKEDEAANKNVQYELPGVTYRQDEHRKLLEKEKSKTFLTNLCKFEVTPASLCSSVLSNYKIAVLFGSEIDLETRLSGVQSFDEFSSIGLNEVLQHVVEWMDIGETVEEVKAVGKKNEALGTCHEVAELFSEIAPLLDVNIDNGICYFTKLMRLARKQQQERSHETRPIINAIKIFCTMMMSYLWESKWKKIELQQRKLAEKTAKERKRKNAGRSTLNMLNTVIRNNGDSSVDDSDIRAYKKPKLEIPTPTPESRLHTALEGIWDKLLDTLTSGMTPSPTYLRRGLADTSWTFRVPVDDGPRISMNYELACLPDGLVDMASCFPDRDRGYDSTEYGATPVVPCLVLHSETKSSACDGWSLPVYQAGRPASLTVPVVPGGGSGYISSSSSSGEEQNGQDEQSLQKKATGCGRLCISQRLARCKTQHIVELLTALKTGQRVKFRRKIYGLYVSDHLVYLTSLEVQAPADMNNKDIRTFLRERDLDKLAQKCQRFGFKYKAIRSPFPLNLFCKQHFLALTYYLSYIFSEKSYAC